MVVYDESKYVEHWNHSLTRNKHAICCHSPRARDTEIERLYRQMQPTARWLNWSLAIDFVCARVSLRVAHCLLRFLPVRLCVIWLHKGHA